MSRFECANKEGVSVRRGLRVRSPFVAIWFAMPSVILGLCLLMWVCVESFPAFFAWPPSASEVSERLFPAIAAFARNLPEVEESCTAVGLQKLIVQTMRRYVNVRAVQETAVDAICSFIQWQGFSTLSLPLNANTAFLCAKL